MLKKFSGVFLYVVFIAAVTLGLTLTLDTVRPGSTLAEDAKKCACKRGCECEHCRGKASECPCGKKKKCAKCGHVKCPGGDCKRCPECLLEAKQKEEGGW